MRRLPPCGNISFAVRQKVREIAGDAAKPHSLVHHFRIAARRSVKSRAMRHLLMQSIAKDETRQKVREIAGDAATRCRHILLAALSARRSVKSRAMRPDDLAGSVRELLPPEGP